MEPKGHIQDKLTAVVPAESIPRLFAELDRRLGPAAAGACVYIEHYGGKERTQCSTKDELLAQLNRTLDFARFPDCAVDVCATVGYRGDRATFVSEAITGMFPAASRYTLFCCGPLQNVHAYTQKAVRNKLFFACAPLQKVNFYNVLEDMLRPFRCA